MPHAHLALPLLLAPLVAFPAMAAGDPLSPPAYPTGSALDEARIDVLAGRAVLVGGGTDAATLRRGDRTRTAGRAHLEIAVGAEVRIMWTETLSMDVLGPASFQWGAEGARVTVLFHELSWADLEVRAGEHTVHLPSDWTAEVGRSAVALRGLAGGPTEVMVHAGQPARLEWTGDPTRARPPVALYPGSSVRLDRPRHTREGVAPAQGGPEVAPWPDELGAAAAPQVGWPWRSRTDDEADVAHRLEMARTVGRLDEVPGTPGGQVERIRRVEADGRTSDLELEVPGTATYAQVPVAPSAPVRYTVTPRGEGSTPAEGAPTDEAPGATDPGAARREVWDTDSSRRARGVELRDLTGRGPTPQGPGELLPFAAELAPAPAPARAVAMDPQAPVPFRAEQWRGLDRKRLNGVGVIAAERGAGVEVRILGGGRTKVFVSSGSPSPRWCFTPHADYLMQPGAVAVFEPSGAVRMSFGTMEEHQPLAGRPAFDRLDAR